MKNDGMKKQICKHIIYVVLLLLTYVLQVTPRLFEWFGAKPFLLIAVAVLIAMFEGEFIGGIYGALAGLLCDTAAFTLFGFNGFLLCACCIGIGLLSVNLLQPHLGSSLLYAALTTFLIRNIQFLFSFGIFKYSGLALLYPIEVLLPTLYTTFATLALFFPIRTLSTALNAGLEQ